MERRSFVRNAALVSAGILGSVPLLATPTSINLSELSTAERKLLADYEQIVRKSTALSEQQALQLLGAKAILRRDENGMQLKTAAGAIVQLKRQGDQTVAQFK